MKKSRINDENEFNELVNSIDNSSDTLKIKSEINKLIPNDVKIVAKNKSQENLINSIKNNEITICAGPPGTGKTYLSVAYALNFIKKLNTKYKRIYLVKSVLPLKGEEIGYIKGDWKEKVDPFMWSFYFNFEKIIGTTALKGLIDKDIIRPFPLAYMRGATLDDCIIISDESQNISTENLHTLMTRIGTNCKSIVLGDINQIDLKNKEESSLDKVLTLFENTDNFGVIRMNEDDTNIRNPLIDVIEKKFKTYFEENKPVRTSKKKLLTE